MPTVVKTIPANVNVRDYGAIGDGTTDDTAALLAALAAAYAKGLPLYIPAGRYRYKTTLPITASIHILGSGSIGGGNAFLMYEGTGSAILIEGPSYPSSWIYSIVLESFGVASYGNNGSIGIDCRGVSEFALTNMAVGLDSHGFDTGLYLVDSTLLNMSQPVIAYSRVCGMDLAGSKMWIVHGSWYDNLTEIRIRAATSIDISGNHFEKQDYGIVIEDSTGVNQGSDYWIHNNVFLFNTAAYTHQVALTIDNDASRVMYAKNIHFLDNAVTMAGGLSDVDYPIVCDLANAGSICTGLISGNTFSGATDGILSTNHSGATWQIGSNYSANAAGSLLTDDWNAGAGDVTVWKMTGGGMAVGTGHNPSGCTLSCYEKAGATTFGLKAGSAQSYTSLMSIWDSSDNYLGGINYAGNYVLTRGTAIYMSGTPGGTRIVLTTGDSETGSNAGTNFAILRYSDASAYLGCPFEIFRQDGRVLMAGTHYYSGTAAPATGTWAAGSICWNSAPASGNPIGWMCTAAGTPGTWVAMPNLA